MFEFISKLLQGRPATKKNSQQVIVDLHKNLLDEEKQKSKEQERLDYLQKVAAINDENALLDLLLACDFADGRLQAAQKILMQSNIERALPAMRKLDKRVAKLLQSRLDAYAQNAQDQLAALACIGVADRLLLQPTILSNQVVELDKQTALLKKIPEELKTQLAEKRQILTQRLEQQIQLQQRLLGLMQELQTLEASFNAPVDAVSDVDSTLTNAKYQAWQATIDACVADKNADSLPKNLLAECQNKLLKLRGQESVQQRIVVRVSEEVLTEMPSSDVNIQLTAKAQIPVTTVASERKKVSKPSLALSLEQIEHVLLQMESALEQGSVQNARQFDRELRDVDTKQSYANLVLSTELKERINLARKALLHLLSWAKWSGDASRDELVNTAEGLAGLKLQPQEIVGTVSALREQWKQTEAKSGGASKELWTRFDAACNAAYAPAAQFFAEQSAQRKQNLAQAEAKLEELHAQVSALLAALAEAAPSGTTQEKPNWKAISSSIQHWQQSWRTLGQIDRKDKLRLDKAFYALLDQLRLPLAQRQKQEIDLREQIILTATQLDGSQKSSLDQLRLLQQQWQTQAASISLPRQEEQALWERFRTACDAVFAEKRANVEHADKQRQENLQAKEAICADLISMLENTTNSAQQIVDKMKSATLAWHQIGQVPRAQEQPIEKNFQQLLETMQQQVRLLQNQAQQQKSQSVLAKIDICLQLESLLAMASIEATKVTALKQAWSATTLPKSLVSQTLQERFDSACDAVDQLQNSGASEALLAVQVEDTAFKDILLHLEILLGIDSPAELSRERLQKQVEVLQASLRAGQDQKQVMALLNQVMRSRLCSDEKVQQRMRKVFQQANLMVQ